MRSILLSLALSACVFSPSPYPVGAEDTARVGVDTALGAPVTVPCDDTVTALGLDDVSSLGFSGRQVLDAAAGPFASPAEYPDSGATTTVTLGVAARAGDVLQHDREPSNDTGAAFGADAQCTDFLELPVTVSLTTDDGAFAEVVDATIQVTDPAAVSVSAPLDWAALGGAFDIATIADPAAWDVVTLGFGAVLLPEASGQIDVSASRDVGPNTGEGLVGPVLRWPGD